jgi:hypothetical protein
VYEYSDGRIVDVVGGGSYKTSRFLSEFERIGFAPFDYDAEIQRARASRQREGGVQLQVDVMDGAQWEIFISSESGPFTLRKWN